MLLTPLAMGSLSGKYDTNTVMPADDNSASGEGWMEYYTDGKANSDFMRKLDALCGLLTSGGRTLVQGALGWLWGQANTNIPIMSMCLSAHRKYPLGSASQKTREQGLDILVKAIEFASEIGLRIIQVSGYDAFYEPSNEQTQARYLEGLHQGIQWAGAKGVMLGLENVDTPFVEALGKALRVVNELNSPWFHLYPDMGNLLAAGYFPPEELRLAKNHLIALHVKDAKHGIIRGVPFEKGEVPFHETFQALAEIGYRGPLTVEMWADLGGVADPLSSVMVLVVAGVGFLMPASLSKAWLMLIWKLAANHPRPIFSS